jgi:hypothetical protein
MAAITNQNGIILKQAVAYTRAFYFGTTGQTVTVNLSKNGGTFGAAAGAVTEIASGWYKIALTSADTGSIGDLAYFCTASSGGPLNFIDQVQATILADINIDVSGNVTIGSSIKKNAACNGFMFIMTDTTNHAPKTGLTVTAQRSLGGAGFSACANAVSELSNGVYTINLAASDTNNASLMLRFTATGADDLDILMLTQP